MGAQDSKTHCWSTEQLTRFAPTPFLSLQLLLRVSPPNTSPDGESRRVQSFLLEAHLAGEGWRRGFPRYKPEKQSLGVWKAWDPSFPTGLPRNWPCSFQRRFFPTCSPYRTHSIPQSQSLQGYYYFFTFVLSGNSFCSTLPVLYKRPFSSQRMWELKQSSCCSPNLMA